jgi:micrococcal nuclease
VTPWGKEASRFAAQVLPPGARVSMEFPGSEPALVGTAFNVNYLDNFERPLAYIHLEAPVDGASDLTEVMIRKGFSPYFVKYGRAHFPGHDARYAAAERAAQSDNIGVWNQLAANGALSPDAAPRNYARLMVWWELRARVIDGFRAVRAAHPDAPVFDTRLDYARLLELAGAGARVTVFMELTSGQTVGGTHYLIRSGSNAQRFGLFMPNEDRPEIRAVQQLLANRYIADGEDFPRRNYAYVTGTLKLFAGAPEMTVDSVDQISDAPPAGLLG